MVRDAAYLPYAERFWDKVEVRGANDCWPWKASSGRAGRGRFFAFGHSFTSPNFALRLVRSEPPEGKPFACHECDNPPCCNPNHLWWGSNADNLQDASRKKRLPRQTATVCVHGHAIEGANQIVRKSGKVVCRICYLAHAAKWRADPANRKHMAEHQFSTRRAKAASRAALSPAKGGEDGQ